MQTESSSRICEEFPLHWFIWKNDYDGLLKELRKKEHNIELLDPRGRTPLHLAVTLGHVECVKALLRQDANANAENSGYWSVLQEAVSSGDPETVQAVLQHRDYQRFMVKTEGVPALLERLKESPDFFVEMRWEFTSWVPLVSRLCPNDTYKVWKSGSNVRIDTTLLGFDNRSWKRGNRSFLFCGSGDSAEVMEVDHDAGMVYKETIKSLIQPPSIDLARPSEDDISQRLLQPIVTAYLDTDNIAFERSKTGVWGWRTDKTEGVNGYDCKVFSAANVQFVTKTRTEHLTESDKKQKRWTESLSPLENFFGLAQQSTPTATKTGEAVDIHNPCNITPEQYFDPLVSLGKADIGRPIEQSSKIQKFKAALSLCESYPLSLQEQVLPVIDLMATHNAHFRRLKDFITLQLPAGFPVKIEIPLFHVLNAKITFGNVFGRDRPEDHVHMLLAKKSAEGEEEKIEAAGQEKSSSKTFQGSVTLRNQVAAKISTDDTSVTDDRKHFSDEGNGGKLKDSFTESIEERERTGSGADSPCDPAKEVVTCAVDEEVFRPPASYRVIGESQRRNVMSYDDEEDQLLQFTLQQSLQETSVSERGAPTGSAHPSPAHLAATEDAMLQRAIAASLGQATDDAPPPSSESSDDRQAADGEGSPTAETFDEQQLRMAMALSEEADRRRERQEELERREAEELEKILALSLTDK